MDKYKIIWSPQAYEDLDKIHFYIEHFLKEPQISNNILNKILKLVDSLKFFPERYPKVFNIAIENIHRVAINNYIVIYKVDNYSRSNIYFTYFSF